MTTLDPQPLYAACRDLEDATGRKIDQGIVERAGDLYITGHDPYIDRSVSARNDEAAARILRDALWEAVREICEHAEWSETIESDDGEYPIDPVRVCRVAINFDGGYRSYPDLPAAAHAIAAFVRGSK